MHNIFNVYFHFNLKDCPANVDEVWNIQWPFAPAGTTVTVPCGVDFVGMAYNNIIIHYLY